MTDTTINPGAEYDPYDPDQYRRGVNAIPSGMKTALHRIAVARPSKFVFFQLHPDRVYSFQLGLIEHQKDTYMVSKALEFEPLLQRFMKWKNLLLGVTIDGSPFLWPISERSEVRANAWTDTAYEVALEAQRGWRALYTQEGVDGYKSYAPEDPTKYPAPVWPDLAPKEILKLAFPGERLISQIDHPVIKALRGA